MNGMQMMFEQLLKSSGVDLAQITGQFEAMGQLIAEFKAQSDRIEEKQNLILELLQSRKEVVAEPAPLALNHVEDTLNA